MNTDERVKNLLDQIDEILRDYPYLETADFPAVYAYATQAGRERLLR